MSPRIFLPWLSAAAVFFSASQALAVTDADRIAVYRDFLTQYQAKKYADAQPLAEKLVALHRRAVRRRRPAAHQPADQSRDGSLPPGPLPAGHRGLPAHAAHPADQVHHRRQAADHAAARPGRGLPGQQGSGVRGGRAQRAADLSRNTDGLFNINQVEFIDPLVDAYAATGRYAEAEKEAQYALRIEEAAFGRNSIRLVRPPRQARELVRVQSPLHQPAQCLRPFAGHPGAQVRRRTTCGASSRCAASRAPIASKRSMVSKAPTPAPRSTCRQHRCAGVRRRQRSSARRGLADRRARGGRKGIARRPGDCAAKCSPIWATGSSCATRCDAPTTTTPRPGRPSSRVDTTARARAAARCWRFAGR